MAYTHTNRALKSVALDQEHIEGVQWDPQTRLLTIHMSGTGGLYPYAIGVGGALQDYVDMDHVCFITSSGSGCPHMACIADLPSRDTLMLWERRKRDFMKRHGIFNVLSMDHARMLYAHTKNCVECGNSLLANKRCKQQKVWVSSSERMERYLVGHFTSKSDWADSLFVSASFVPVPHHSFLNEWANRHNLGKCMDGERPCTREMHESPTHGPVMRFPITGTTSSSLKNIFWKTYLIVTGLLWDHSYTYEDGYRDAMKYIVPFCAARVPRAPSSSQTFSSNPSHEINHQPVTFDIKKRTFLHAKSSTHFDRPINGAFSTTSTKSFGLRKLVSSQPKSVATFPSFRFLPSAPYEVASAPAYNDV